MATCRHAEDAAAMVAIIGGFVRYRRIIAWDEGNESISAAESYDQAAEVMHRRIFHFRAKHYMKTP